ncbi:ribokinase [Angustibacter sp. McL0619]|uniref:ribokinase n=1 Tax=Angustibacter sp. McL0619 TaxID=3415676 RepID=UPI003CF7E033
MASPAIAVVGSTMTDLVTYVQRAPEAGETVVGDRFVVGYGGKGANQAVMARRLGASVAFVGCLGDDSYGDRYLAHLADEGVDVTAVHRVPCPSGVAPIWVEPDGTNRIIVVPGANDALTPSRAQQAVQQLSDVQVVVGQLEVPQAATAAGLAAARQRGAITVLNPAPYASVSAELLAQADWMVPNEVEFTELAREHQVGPADGADPRDEAQVRALAEVLGCGLVVTLGADGAAVLVGSQVHRVQAPAVRAVDTTGAGDGFVGAFVVGLAQGLDPLAAARLGCACASWSVERDGTQTSYPSAQQATELRTRLAAELET